MNHYITHHRCEFITFCLQHTNMKERFNYLFIEMIWNKIFCFDIYMKYTEFCVESLNVGFLYFAHAKDKYMIKALFYL